jgi:predicted ABC-class ATPase
VGDYFNVSDLVIQMKNYQPSDMTSKAYEIAKLSPVKRDVEDETYPFQIRERIPISDSIDPFNDYGKFSIYAKEVHRLNFGKQVIDLTDLEQLIELSQTKALGYAIDVISDRISGHFAIFRAFELAFAVNRLRSLQVIQKP